MRNTNELAMLQAARAAGITSRDEVDAAAMAHTQAMNIGPGAPQHRVT